MVLTKAGDRQVVDKEDNLEYIETVAKDLSPGQWEIECVGDVPVGGGVVWTGFRIDP